MRPAGVGTLVAAATLTDREVLLMGIFADAVAFCYFGVRLYLEIQIARRLSRQQRELEEERLRWEQWRARQQSPP